MRVFLSWSGERSLRVAEALRDWLPMTLQAIEPFLSADMAKGTQWSLEINRALTDSKLGIICLTQDNLDAPWLLFEAGALSRSSVTNVCTFLLDVTETQVRPPLGMFQHTENRKEDVRSLVRTLNDQLAPCGERPLATDTRERVFENNWPVLESRLKAIPSKLNASPIPARSEREILEEILSTIRSQAPTLRPLGRGTERCIVVVPHDAATNLHSIVLYLMNHPKVYSVGPLFQETHSTIVLFEGRPGVTLDELTARSLDLMQFGLYWGAVGPCGPPATMDFPKNFVLSAEAKEE